MIITTIDIIDELGIMGLSTREIANKEGVSEATLFRHYKNKNDLLKAVLDYFTKFDKDMYHTTKLKKLSPLDSIRFLINSLAEYYENYPAITVLTQLMDTLKYEPEFEDKIKSIILTRTRLIQQLIDGAKGGGELVDAIDTEILADIITGTIREVCLKWRLDRNFSLKERINSSINSILASFSL